MPPLKTHLPLQLLLAAGALIAGSIIPRSAFWPFLVAYALLWLVFNLVARQARGLVLPLSPWAAAVLVLALCAGPVLSLWAKKTDIAWGEGLHGLSQHFVDRSRLELLPAVAPGILFAGHPQTFYVHAPGTQQVVLRLAPGILPLMGEDLGQGLFRVFYDPRLQGVPQGDSARIESSLEADGRVYRRQLRSVRFEAHPRWFSSVPALGLAATPSEETDEIFVVSRLGLQLRLPVGDGPTAAVFVRGGKWLAVSHRYSEELWLVDPESGEIGGRRTLGPFQSRLAASPSGDLLAVAMGGLRPRIELLKAADLSSMGSIFLTQAAADLAFGRSDGELVLSIPGAKELALWRQPEGGAAGATWVQETPLQLGRPVVTMARGAGGREIFIATTDYRPGGESHRGNHFIQDQVLTVDLASWKVTGQRLTPRRTPAQTEAGNVDSGLSPMGMMAREDGSLLVALAGSDEVWELPTGPDSGAPPRVLAAGYDLDLIAPHGVADLGEGYWAASSPAGGCIAVFGPTGELLEFIGVAPSDDRLLDSPADSLARQALLLRTGERAFYEGTRSGISCQSCHLHGGTDESLHDIGQEPLLPTLTVRGITGTAPYLRDGSFPLIRDLDDHLAGNLYRGYQRYVEGRGRALEAFVESLPRPVNPRHLLRASERPGGYLEMQREGAQAFVAARCVLCHSFPAFTNLSQHPVRSLFPEYGSDLRPVNRLDTPSLLGSHDRLHFLQDGRAHSLSEVLTEHNLSNRHGDSQALTEPDRLALAEFLLSL